MHRFFLIVLLSGCVPDMDDPVSPPAALETSAQCVARRCYGYLTHSGPRHGRSTQAGIDAYEQCRKQCNE